MVIRPDHRYYGSVREDGLEWWFGLSIATMCRCTNQEPGYYERTRV